jgi:excinuclease ABC subunit A
VPSAQYSVPSAPSNGGDNSPGSSSATTYVVVDRLAAGGATEQRVRDSLETAFAKGQGKCFAFVEEPPSPQPSPGGRGGRCTIDGQAWRRLAFSNALACADCGIEYVPPEPRLFSFNSPLGACPNCEGFGNIIGVDMDLVVPDPGKSLRDGAIAPWNTPAYSHELEELLALAPDYDLPVDVPFSQLTAAQRELIEQGVPERKFGGLDGFFAWLERRKYKMHIRVFLSRWRSYRPCPACGGTRLRPEALDARIGGRNIAAIAAMQISEAAEFFRAPHPLPLSRGERGDPASPHPLPLSRGERGDRASPHPLPLSQGERGDRAEFFRCPELSDWQRRVGRMMLEQVQLRLGYLESVGLGYLTLDRTIRTLSGGEARRVALTSALGSSLVNMLYVLDEPSIGLHPRDVDALVASIRKLRDRANTVVVVEHEEAMIRAADHVIEIGPGAGERGGRIVFQGTPAEMEASPDSLTGAYLAGRRGSVCTGQRRQPNRGWIRLAGARGNNLKNVTVEFPLGVLCLVTGVSGAGKSTLVEDTLYPALCRRLRKDRAPCTHGRRPLECDDVFGDGQIDDVIMIDQDPIGRSPRSNPVTYLKVFDEIRSVFAETIEARTRNYDAGKFSFNVDGGRCSACQGDGYIRIDMQFLADVFMKCSQCHGTRYRDEILDVTYRGRNIAEVLDMTVREAFTFFRGQPKVQSRLKRLIDVGLDYVRLGQPANTLSGGEAQRLKLAGYMSAAKRGRCLFLLDEPTTGLHFSDTVQLLDCFDALLAVGHSLIVVEHNLQMMKAADYIIDLGPGAADQGGRVVAKGTPEMVARSGESVTARFLEKVLGEQAIPVFHLKSEI